MVFTTHDDIEHTLRGAGLLKTLKSLECLVENRSIDTDKRWENLAEGFIIVDHLKLGGDIEDYCNSLFSGGLFNVVSELQDIDNTDDFKSLQKEYCQDVSTRVLKNLLHKVPKKVSQNVIFSRDEIEDELRRAGTLKTLQSLECLVENESVHTDERWKGIADMPIIDHLKLGGDIVEYWHQLVGGWVNVTQEIEDLNEIDDFKSLQNEYCQDVFKKVSKEVVKNLSKKVSKEVVKKNKSRTCQSRPCSSQTKSKMDCKNCVGPKGDGTQCWRHKK